MGEKVLIKIVVHMVVGSQMNMLQIGKNNIVCARQIHVCSYP